MLNRRIPDVAPMRATKDRQKDQLMKKTAAMAAAALAIAMVPTGCTTPGAANRHAPQRVERAPIHAAEAVIQINGMT